MFSLHWWVFTPWVGCGAGPSFGKQLPLASLWQTSLKIRVNSQFLLIFTPAGPLAPRPGGIWCLAVTALEEPPALNDAGNETQGLGRVQQVVDPILNDVRSSSEVGHVVSSQRRKRTGEPPAPAGREGSQCTLPTGSITESSQRQKRGKSSWAFPKAPPGDFHKLTSGTGVTAKFGTNPPGRTR